MSYCIELGNWHQLATESCGYFMILNQENNVLLLNQQL